jgi:purine nucleosidase
LPRKIIIDTDPGQDDAVAILAALAAPEELEVLGIVAVAGNVGLRQNALNALKVVELSGRTEIPVYAGCEHPLRRPLVTAEHVHGKTGLDGPDLPDPQIRLGRSTVSISSSKPCAATSQRPSPCARSAR